jgi:hypothetical protein
MRTKTLTRWFVVGFLSTSGLFGLAVQAAAQPGPEGTEAGIVQEGDNEGTSTQAGTSNSGDAGAGSQITGIVSEPGSTTSVSKTNESEDSESTSGDSTVASTQSVDVGPRGTAEQECPGNPAGASLEGPIGACIVQDGDNTVDAAQTTAGASGDALAGTQVTGIVNGGDTVVVDASNTADDAQGTSGDAEAFNDLFASAGPVLADTILSTGNAASIEGPVAALIVQDGDNDVSGEQDAAAGTGDAVAGSQVHGIVNAGEGNVSVATTQTSEDAESTTGNATAGNDDPLHAGDVFGTSVSIGGTGVVRGSGTALGEVTDSSITGPITGAGIVHEGDNAVDVSQNAGAATGDAVAAGQIVGIVNAGDVDLTLDNTSDGDEATSGDSDAFNDTGIVFAGNVYASDEGGDIEVASIEGPITTLPAGIVHEGDNDAGLDQGAAATSGDAVAGAQISGGVIGAGGSFTAEQTNASEDSESTSGNSLSENFADTVFVGNAAADGEVELGSISDVTGAGVVHEGDNEVDATEQANSATGDAVTGASIVGIVGSGDTSIVTDNTTEDAEATSGDGTSTNDLNLATAGNLMSDAEDVDLPDEASIDGVTTDDGGIVHDGDNTTELGLTADTATGDAVAGGQVVGAVTAAGGSFAADLTNSSEDDQADSGAATADTFVNSVASGNLSGDGNVFLGSISDVDGGAGIVHEGDNDLTLDASASGATGDAVAGGQVVGGVGGGDMSVTLDNTSEDSEATSGDASGLADVLSSLSAGNAFAEEGDVEIDSIELVDVAENGIVHDGDNQLDAALDASGSSGDAVAGGQVAGIVSAAGGSVAIDGTNDAEDAQSVSGDGDAEAHFDHGVAGNLSAESVFVGADSISDVSGDAGIIHEGENSLDVTESAEAASGDAVGGGQVFGAVGAGDVSIVADNASEDADATSGNAFSVTDVDDAVAGNAQADRGDIIVDADSIEGPISLNGQGIVQDGDNANEIGLTAGSGTGDAVAGGQVAGVVSAAGGSTSIDITNSSEDDQATSGEADADATVFSAVAGNLSADSNVFVSSIDADITDGAIVHDGDNDLSIDGDASAASGDAVGGGQVVGAVGGGDADIVASNTSEDSDVTSGDGLSSTLVATAVAGNIVAQEGDVDLSSIDGSISGVEVVHEGDNSLDIGQQAAAASGDAVGGGQVVGAVTSAGGSLSVDTTNTAEDAESTSGDATADETVESAFVGNLFTDGTLEVGGAAIDANISGAAIVLDGDNDGTIGQSLDVASGDAVAGGQIIGAVVTGGTADVVQDNTSEDDQTTTGNATGTKLLDSFLIGPVVAGDIVSGGDVA